jgi:hypothetical protein
LCAGGGGGVRHLLYPLDFGIKSNLKKGGDIAIQDINTRNYKYFFKENYIFLTRITQWNPC